MRKFLFAAAGIALLGASACSKAPDCTAEMLTQKGQELTVVLQAAVTKDPSKAAELTAKVQEITTKYQGSTAAADACKAYDELIAAFKG